MDFPQINRKKVIILNGALLALGAVALFDKTLAFGLIVALFLAAASFLIFDFLGVKSRLFFLIFFTAFAVHLMAVIFIYATGFQPFSNGRGDFTTYHVWSQEIANRLHSGNFSLEGIEASHSYHVLVGYIYALTLPSMLMGQIFNAWLSALIVVLAYLTIIEMGGSRLGAFLTSMAVNLYPSLLFFGSLLLREALVSFLAILGLFMAVKLIKRFTAKNFLVFYIALGLLIHFRFNIGYPLIFAFIPSWILFSPFSLKKRAAYGMVMILLLGFLPVFSAQGYFGVTMMKSYLNFGVIEFYREIAYTPLIDQHVEKLQKISRTEIKIDEPQKQVPAKDASEHPQYSFKFSDNIDSTVTVETGDTPFAFVKNFLINFLYNLLGPFPWQLTKQKHLFALLETIPWFFLFVLSAIGFIVSISKRNYLVMPIALFAIITLSVLGLFFTNFGIITRVRIPAMIALIYLTPFAFEKVALWEKIRATLKPKA